MKVLLLGPTGNVGTRLLPALLSHNHTVVAYVRNPSKLSTEAKSNLDAIVTGSATDSAAIKNAILTHKCDAVVNAAGVAAMMGWSYQGDFQAIFEAVVRAAREAGGEREESVRLWCMSGFGVLDGPGEGSLIVDYMPLFPSHRGNYQLIKSHPTDQLAWSLFCATQMFPQHPTPQFPPPSNTAADLLVAKGDSPPAWNEKYRSIPLIGNYLNIMAQSQSYFATLENCVDFIAADLESGLESEWIGKRVGVKEKSKVL